MFCPTGALLWLSALTLQAQPFSLEDVLSAPYVETAVFAPEAPRVAWVVNQEGVRNIWMADAPDFRPAKVTHYTEDDGQVLDNLTFTPDGRLLVYVRGEGPNRRGEYPNPRSLPDGVRREVWVVELATGWSFSIWRSCTTKELALHRAWSPNSLRSPQRSRPHVNASSTS